MRFSFLLTGLLAMPFLSSGESATWKFSSPEKWDCRETALISEPGGMRLTIPETPKWGKPPVIYSLREKSAAGLKNTESVTLDVELAAGEGATAALYLKDAQGEYFSYPQRPLKKGKNHLSWQIATGFNGNWGEAKNGKVDYPVSLEALQIHQYPAASPAELFFVDPAYALQPGERAVTVPLFAFDESGKWNVSGGLQSHSDGKTLTLQSKTLPAPGASPLVHTFREPFFELRDIGNPFLISLSAELVKGGGATLAMTVMDSTGEYFAMNQKPLKKGLNKVVWNFPADIAGSWGKNKDGKLTPPLRLIDLQLIQYAASEAAEIRFLSGEKREIRQDVQAVDFSYETGRPFPVLKTGEEKQFGLKLHNRYPEKNVFSAHLVLRHYSGDREEFRQTFELAPGAETVWMLNWNAQKPRGVWRADLTLKSADGRRRYQNSRTSFAYLEPAGPNSVNNREFIVGVNMRQQHWSLADRRIEAELAAISGAKLLRTGFTWEGIERKEGHYDFTQADALMALNNQYNMQHMFMIAYTPYFAAKPELQKSKDWNDWNKSVPDLDKLERFTRVLAEHYRGRIEFYEFWNEPDLSFWRGTLAEYLAAQKRVYRALKAGDPDAKLISGGVAGDLTQSKPGFHAGLVRDGQEDFDFHGFHQHGDFATYKRVIGGSLAEVRKSLKTNKPIFFTETGFYVSNGNYLTQAANVLQKIVYARLSGARGYIWFDLRDDGFLPGYCEHNYGLVTHDWFPKEGYAVYNTVNRLLQEASFAGTVLENSRSSIYFFRRGADQVLPLWKNSEHGVEEPITLLTDAREAFWTDWMGNRTALPLTGGRVSFSMPTYPGFVELLGASRRPVPGQPIITLADDNLTAVRGRALPLAMKVCNVLPQEATLRLEWQEQPGVKIDGAHFKLRAGEEKSWTPVLLASEAASEPLRLKLGYHLGTESGRVDIPVNLAKPIMAGDFSKEPQFRLVDRNSVVSQMEHNPYTAHRVWSGPQDQSALIYLAAVGNTLRVKIEVTDDIAVKSASAQGCFMEDGIQLALAIAGQKGHWEFGFARLHNGTDDSHVWIQPTGYSSFKPALRVEQKGKTVIYDIEFPFEKLGVNREILKKGIQFNVLINDNDGEGRDGWIQIAPGIGEAKIPGLYPFVTLVE